MPDTFDYFVWVEVTPGIAALNIAMVPGRLFERAAIVKYTPGEDSTSAAWALR